MAEADLNKSINYPQLSMCVYVCKLRLLNNVIPEAPASITFNYLSLRCLGSRCTDSTPPPGEPVDPGGPLRVRCPPPRSTSTWPQAWGRGPGLGACPRWPLPPPLGPREPPSGQDRLISSAPDPLPCPAQAHSDRPSTGGPRGDAVKAPNTPDRPQEPPSQV